MGNSIKKRDKAMCDCMGSRRNFSMPCGQLVKKDPLIPDLFMKIGTYIALLLHTENLLNRKIQ